MIYFRDWNYVFVKDVFYINGLLNIISYDLFFIQHLRFYNLAMMQTCNCALIVTVCSDKYMYYNVFILLLIFRFVSLSSTSGHSKQCSYGHSVVSSDIIHGSGMELPGYVIFSFIS